MFLVFILFYFIESMEKMYLSFGILLILKITKRKDDCTHKHVLITSHYIFHKKVTYLYENP